MVACELYYGFGYVFDIAFPLPRVRFPRHGSATRTAGSARAWTLVPLRFRQRSGGWLPVVQSASFSRFADSQLPVHSAVSSSNCNYDGYWIGARFRLSRSRCDANDSGDGYQLSPTVVVLMSLSSLSRRIKISRAARSRRRWYR